MAFDGIVTKALVEELSSLEDARIDKVFQPGKNNVIIGMYKNKQNFALNICTEAQNCRIHLTTKARPNPKVAPNFCMVLRKNLIGLKLKKIYTLDLERLVVIDFENFDELDNLITKKLVIELMGKHSNIILIDEQSIIIDSLRHIKEVDENFRNILPHTKYIFPTSDKQNFLEISNSDSFSNCLKKDILIKDIPIEISTNFNGISKNFVAGIMSKLSIKLDSNPLKNSDITDCYEKIYNYILDIINNIGSNNLSFEEFSINKEITPNRKKTNSKIIDYMLVKKSNAPQFDLNFFIDDFYYNKETSENFKNYRDTMLKLILNHLKKYNKRLYNIDEKLKECEDMEKYKIWGELIIANLYKIPNKNIEKITLENYYDNNNEITINLDKKYNTSTNAKRFFKKYNKLKNTLAIVTEQKDTTLKELNYIESIVYELEAATTLDEISIILEELSKNDILKDFSINNESKNYKVKKSKFTKNANSTFNPIKYTVGKYTVLVGRNNLENDYLTLKYANKNDIWFHTKDFHGSHVILKLDKNEALPNNSVLTKVAKLAALHSKAKNSSNVPVDFCEVKFVKKPSGAKPGMVIYSHNKTLNVTPAQS